MRFNANKINYVYIGLTLLSLVISVACFAVEIGKPSLELKAKVIDGQTFDLSSEKGNVVIINFWATWCSHCRAEMPALDAYYKKYKSHGLKVLAVSVDDPADDKLVKNIITAFSFPVALERDTQYGDFGRIWHVPMTFVIDRNGILRRDGNAADPKIDLSILEKTVTPLLQEQ